MIWSLHATQPGFLPAAGCKANGHSPGCRLVAFTAGRRTFTTLSLFIGNATTSNEMAWFPLTQTRARFAACSTTPCSSASGTGRTEMKLALFRFLVLPRCCPPVGPAERPGRLNYACIAPTGPSTWRKQNLKGMSERGNSPTHWFTGRGFASPA